MSQEAEALTRLAADLVAIYSRSAVSNLPLADRIEGERRPGALLPAPP
jgi:hypothetical protein